MKKAGMKSPSLSRQRGALRGGAARSSRMLRACGARRRVLNYAMPEAQAWERELTTHTSSSPFLRAVTLFTLCLSAIACRLPARWMSPRIALDVSPEPRPAAFLACALPPHQSATKNSSQSYAMLSGC